MFWRNLKLVMRNSLWLAIGVSREPQKALIPWSHARAIADFEPVEVLKEWGVG
jgi:hypothetical protein